MLKRIFLLLSGLFLAAGCSSPDNPPAHPENICKIFEQYPHWADATFNAEKKWGEPASVMMSIMYQESAYRYNAQPPVRWALIIPYGRASSAYGFPQAKDEAWANYEQATGTSGSRENFEDSINFIGWYMSVSARKNGVGPYDGYRHYLNYHEGWGGYAKGTYSGKDWLIKVARKVDSRAKTYEEQLDSCGY